MITLYSHTKGPNGWKVDIVLELLGLQYETKFLRLTKGEQKDPEFTKYNPNGRIPAIVDHDNGDFVLWESIAIIKYLVDRYDKENKYHFPAGTKEAYELDQWLIYQASGQGPYFGQAHYFGILAEEKIPFAIDRYRKEIIRIISVLDGALVDKEYLVGDKLTVADLSFYAYNMVVGAFLGDSEQAKEVKQFKNYAKWDDALTNHPAVQKMLAHKAEANKLDLV